MRMYSIIFFLPIVVGIGNGMGVEGRQDEVGCCQEIFAQDKQGQYAGHVCYSQDVDPGVHNSFQVILVP